MKVSTNRNLNVTQVRTVTHIEPEHWCGYPTFRTHGYELHLSFYDGRVYLNYCRYNSDGWRSGRRLCGTQIDTRVLSALIARCLSVAVFISN